MQPDEYPSVTTILKPYIDTQWFKEEHQIRGTIVHAASLSYLQGLWHPPLKPEYQGYFDSWKRWADNMIVKVVMVETRLYDHDWKLKGKPDLAAILKGDTMASLTDLKTSQAEQKSWKLQIAAYRHLLRKDKGISTHRGMALRLRADGKIGLINEYDRNYKKDLNLFLGALNLYRYFYRK